MIKAVYTEMLKYTNQTECFPTMQQIPNMYKFIYTYKEIDLTVLLYNKCS